mgnify:CR=1 FL=1
MKIIDMRMRPPFGGFLGGMLYNVEGNRRMAERRCLEIAPSVLEKSMERLLEEMDESGVTLGVVTMRKTNGGRNEELLDLLNRYPGRFIGIPQIDPMEGEAALSEIDRCVLDGPCRGIIIEPNHLCSPEQWYITDSRAFPVYEKCQKNGIPLLFTYGGRLVRDQGYLEPVYADRLGFMFPELKMVFCHGGWPHVVQMCHAAVQHPNIYISADVYMMNFTAGWQDYVTAANYQLQDQMMFGSAYPIVSLKEAVGRYRDSLREEVVEKIMYANAARLFNIE